MASPSSRLGVCNLATPLISGTDKATDFKFGRYIYRANPNKSLLKFLEKRERGRIQGLPNFLGTLYISGTGKVTYLKFWRNIHRVDRNKSPWKMLGIVVRKSWKFSGHRVGYTAHCAVIFATAQLSCRTWLFVWWCNWYPENLATVSLTVYELLCWVLTERQTDRQTNKVTDTTENSTIYSLYATLRGW